MAEDIYCRQLRSITTLFQKLAECPVCLETLQIPFRQCVRGHLMCSSCVEPLKCCPLCEGDLSIENPIGVKNILEALPKFCRYSSEGCQEIVESENDHETQCGFRPEPCRIIGCNSVMPVNLLEKHINLEHPNQLFLNGDSNCLITNLLNPFKQRRSNIPVSLFGHLFWFVYTNNIDGNEFRAKFEVTPIGRLEEDYYASVTFAKGKFIYAYTLKAYKGKILKGGESDNSMPTDNIGIQDDGNDVKYCMRMPTSELKRFINKYQDVEYCLKFFMDK